MDEKDKPDEVPDDAGQEDIWSRARKSCARQERWALIFWLLVAAIAIACFYWFDVGVE